MTAETLAAAILRDVTRWTKINEVVLSEPMMDESAVLAALSRAMSDDLAERAGALVPKLQMIHEWMLGRDAADLITAILAQNAALRAERDVALAANRGLVRLNEITEARAERLEAALRLLHENVVLAFPALADLGPVANARAALKGADHE